MKIRSVELKNFRGFESFSASFHDNLTVIVGNNGAGKTSILDALSVAVGTFLAGFDAIKSVYISKEDAMNKCFDMGSVVDLEKQFPVEIKATGMVDDRILSWTRMLNGKDGRTTIGEAKELVSLARDYQSRVRNGDKTTILPILSYYGTGRLWAQKKEKKQKDKIEKFSRLVGYTDCLTAESNEKLMLKWFAKMTIQEAQNGTLSPEFSAVKQAISKCYEGITGREVTSVQFNLDTHEIDIVFIEESGARKRYPMSDLSDGYRNTLSLFADIAYRMAVLNPQLLDNVLAETPGVILVDEIDLHLHPRWQERILGDLRTVFPAVQFIVSTHAPSVISSVKRENLILLDDQNRGYQPTEEVYGSDANSVLNHVMQAGERPREIKGMFSRFYQAVDDEDLQCAEQILDEIEAKIGPGDPELTSARVTLDLERM